MVANGAGEMTATKIMIIRHAEKPSNDGTVLGVSQDGLEDSEELVVKGWQRSGALVRFFVPSDKKFSHPGLATPDVIFASGVAKHSKSLRPQHTVLALANCLGQELVLSHAKGDEDALVADALSRDGTVLIAWEHEAIPGIADQIVGNKTTCPQTWPGDRFDLVWIFNRTAANGVWDFSQVPQLLLPDDRSDVIPVA
jgi:hypothetical protein